MILLRYSSPTNKPSLSKVTDPDSAEPVEQAAGGYERAELLPLIPDGWKWFAIALIAVLLVDIYSCGIEGFCHPKNSIIWWGLAPLSAA